MAFDVPTFLASVLVGGGSAYGLFQFLGGKWIDNRFARQLEASRQEHATETERLKFRVAGLLDRSQKLNQREFEVMPELWAKLDEAFRHCHDLVSPWRTYPDLWRMPEAQFKAFVASCKLEDWQKAELLALPANHRQHYFTDKVSWYELKLAKDAAYQLNSALTKGSIYLSPEVFDRIKPFADEIVMAIHNHQISMQHPDLKQARQPDEPQGPEERFRDGGQARFDELADFLRQRFWTPPTV